MHRARAWSAPSLRFSHLDCGPLSRQGWLVFNIRSNGFCGTSYCGSICISHRTDYIQNKYWANTKRTILPTGFWKKDQLLLAWLLGQPLLTLQPGILFSTHLLQPRLPPQAGQPQNPTHIGFTIFLDLTLSNAMLPTQTWTYIFLHLTIAIPVWTTELTLFCLSSPKSVSTATIKDIQP